MFCQNCGKPLPEDAAFCPECGARTPTGSPSRQTTQPDPDREQPVTDRITRFADGKYRWCREADLLGNASQLRFILRCATGTTLVLGLLVCLGSGLLEFGLLPCLLLLAGLVGVPDLLILIGYPLVVRSIGSRFFYVYEMDEQELRISRRLDQRQDLRWCTAGYVMGLAAGYNYGMDYFNLMSDHSRQLRLGSIRSARWEPERQAQKLWGLADPCRIYMDEQDRDLFISHLKRFCPDLKKVA